MKILPPTLREDNRYIAFSLILEDTISRQDLINEIYHSSSALFGDAGSSELGFRLLSFEGSKGIIRCLADRIWEARAVLASVSFIKGKRTRIKILGISGTVQRATEKYLLTQNITDGGAEREKTRNIKECNIVIDKLPIAGNVVNQKNNNIDLLPIDRKYLEILNRSNTRYIGITVFDVNDMEID